METRKPFRKPRWQIIRDRTEMMAVERRGEGQRQQEWRTDRTSRHPPTHTPPSPSWSPAGA